MDHEQATTTQAAERYILKELTVDEREAFEDHFFTCEECADAVRTCTLLAVNTKALAKEEANRPSTAGQVVEIRTRPVRPAWREWLTAAAAVLVLGTLGFENMVTIPRLKEQASSPGPLESVLLRPLSRGAVPVVHTHGHALVLDLEVGAPNSSQSYEVTVRKAAGSTFSQFADTPSKDGVLHVKWPSSMEPGHYEILVHDPNRSLAEAILYPLEVER